MAIFSLNLSLILLDWWISEMGAGRKGEALTRKELIPSKELQFALENSIPIKMKKRVNCM